MAATRVYPDTSIALHYRPFEEIDWRALIGADDILLVIVSTFLREIDEQKDRGRGTTQKRARRVNSWLTELRRKKGVPLRPGVRVEVNASEPEHAVDFVANGLVASVNDDKFVGCMIRDHEAHPDDSLVCVTADNTLAFKVEALGFKVFEPSKNDRLPDEPEPLELEKRELQKRIVELQSRLDPRPALGVRFVDGEVHSEMLVRVLDGLMDEEIEEYTAAQAQMLEMESLLARAAMSQPPSRATVERYLNDLGGWLTWFSADAIARGLTVDVHLLLVNDGSGNADDIDLELRFPGMITVAEQRAFPDGPGKPARPRGVSLADRISPMHKLALAYPRSAGYEIARALRKEQEPVRFSDQEKPNEIRVHVNSVKHRTDVKLPRLQVWFASPDEVGGGFAIEYLIHAASTPDIVEGTLHIRLVTERGRVQFPKEHDAEPASEDGDEPE